MATLEVQQIQFEQALANLLDEYGITVNPNPPNQVVISDPRLAIIQLAKVKLDEVIPEGEGVQFKLEDDVNISDPLNIMCNALMNEAAKRVLMSCPIHYLDPVKSESTGGIANSDDNKIGYIVLQDNFLRFVALKMADWKREVTHVIRPEFEPQLYAEQQNKYTRGKTAKPKAAFSHRYTGNSQGKVIEYYSVNGSHTIDYLLYIPETLAENVQSNLVDALTWELAGMVLQVTERTDLAKAAFEQTQLCFKNL